MVVYYLEPTLEDTNIVGNIYYASYIRWQGKAREKIVKNLFKDNLEFIFSNFKMITREVKHKYIKEAKLYETIKIELEYKTKDIITTLNFKFFDSNNELLGKGSQKIVFQNLKTNKFESLDNIKKES